MSKNRSIRISDEDWVEIADRAEEAGENVSAFVRRSCLDDTTRAKARLRRAEKAIGEAAETLLAVASLLAKAVRK